MPEHTVKIDEQAQTSAYDIFASTLKDWMIHKDMSREAIIQRCQTDLKEFDKVITQTDEQRAVIAALKQITQKFLTLLNTSKEENTPMTETMRYYYKDFDTRELHYTRAPFIGWTRGGLLNAWYAMFARQSEVMLIPRYLLTKETKELLPAVPEEEKGDHNNA